MLKTRAAITGVGGYVPEYVLSNAILETMVETTDEWISTRTGIKERRILKDPDKATVYMGSQAVKDLLERTGTDPSEIDLTICATVTPDMQFPDCATGINNECGIKNAFGFDLGAACSGFLFALHTGEQYIKAGTCKKVIVVGSDKMSSIVDYTDRTTCVIFGDGAGAVLLEPSINENGITDSIMKSDGFGRQFLYLKSGGSLRPASLETVTNREHFLYQEGRPVFKAAVKGMASSVEDIMKKNGLTKDEIQWVVPHQANNRIINTLADMMDFPLEKVMVNIHKYGNTTAATIPLCLWEWQDQLEKGDNLILTAFGGGFTWGSCLIKWAY
jgi:3-oxoacyl-[acyl-carrier-protein] synthase-3